MRLIVDSTPVPKGRPQFKFSGYCPKCGSRVSTADGQAWASTPENTRIYQDAVMLLARTTNQEKIPVGTPVRMRVTFTLEKKPTDTPDIVNLVALIADTLEGVWYDNNSQIVELQCRKVMGDHAKAYITVDELIWPRR